MQNKQNLTKKIIVTGGGSGGHVSAASAIISSLQNKYTCSNKNFLYIGGDLGMEKEKKGKSVEQKLFSEENFPQEYIRAGKLQRNISLNSIILLLRTTLGIFDSFRIIKRFKPDIVISTGGFVSVPVCLVAKIFKAKIYIHEQTASVGLSNRLVGKFATKIFITFPSSQKYFPADKTIHTGNLVREEIFKQSREGKLYEEIDKLISRQEKYPLIYISGGSLGSHSINNTVIETLTTLLQDYQIILQTGDNKKYQDYHKIKKEAKKLPKELQKNLLVVKYIHKDDIGLVLNNMDLFVGRSGANTVYEIGILQKPAIFIPIPWSTHNEQEENAKILVEAGLAEILPEGELTPEKLILEIKKFSKKKKRYKKDLIEKTFLKNASQKILEELDI